MIDSQIYSNYLLNSYLELGYNKITFRRTIRRPYLSLCGKMTNSFSVSLSIGSTCIGRPEKNQMKKQLKDFISFLDLTLKFQSYELWGSRYICNYCLDSTFLSILLVLQKNFCNMNGPGNMSLSSSKHGQFLVVISRT